VKMQKALLNNVWLKVMALVLALITLFYVSETNKAGLEKTVLQKLLSSTYYISKELRVLPDFRGEVPDGYEFKKADVKVTPASILVVGPSRVLSKKDSLLTRPIELGEHTKEKTLDVELEDITPSLKAQKIKVQVYLPVVKLEDKT